MSNNISIAAWNLSFKKKETTEDSTLKNNTKQKDGVGNNDLSLYQSYDTLCAKSFKFLILNQVVHIFTTPI